MYKKNHSLIPDAQQNQWFTTWFNTPYYHLLYNNRNNEEAESFISNLIHYLNPSIKSRALDLACGAGRHALTLNKFGLDVLGVDIATQSIEEAKAFENDTLHFEVHDMREIVHENHFDYIFNLFTSFGYLETAADDEEIIATCYSQLKKGGMLILDYFNVLMVLQQLPFKGIEDRGEVCFHIEKKLTGNQIVKDIRFQHGECNYVFEEKVAAYNKETLVAMLTKQGFAINDVFGNYALENYSATSERVILIATKQ